MKKLEIIAIVFVAANVADIILTWAVLNMGGVEMNAVMAAVLERGFWTAVVWKVSLPCILAAVLVQKRRLAMLNILAVAFVLIAAWNLTWLVIS